MVRYLHDLQLRGISVQQLLKDSNYNQDHNYKEQALTYS